MKHERATEELREVAALYGMGSLTQQEARSFEKHLEEGCAVCIAEQQKFERAVAQIGIAADEVPPPEYIRDLLAARIEREVQARSHRKQPTLPAEEKTMQELLRPSPIPPRFLSQQTSERPSLLPWVITAVLAILALAAGYAWRSAHGLNLQLQAKASASRADVDDLQIKLSSAVEDSAKLNALLGAVGKSSTRVARLADPAVPSTTSAVAVWNTENGDCLVLGKLPAPPEGKRYQLWFFSPGLKVSAGFLEPDSRGSVLVRVPREAANASAAVITLEPPQGSQMPTAPYYAAGRIE